MPNDNSIPLPLDLPSTADVNSKNFEEIKQNGKIKPHVKMDQGG